jgi:hypothetical protein
MLFPIRVSTVFLKCTKCFGADSPATGICGINTVKRRMEGRNSGTKKLPEKLDSCRGVKSGKGCLDLNSCRCRTVFAL